MKCKCRLCKEITDNFISIGFVPVPICKYCTGLITIQTTNKLVNEESVRGTQSD